MTTKEKADELLDLLLATYPNIFTDDKEQVRPLEIGIHKDLYPWAKAKGYSGTALRRALAMYCGRSSYLYALGGRRERVSLEGKPRGRVSKEHSKEARQWLLERKKRRLKSMQPARTLPKNDKPTLSLRRQIA